LKARSQKSKKANIKVKNMPDKKKKDNISKLSFEEAIKELTGIVGKIEQGEIPLQDSLTQYERGMALIKHCQNVLRTAEQRIEKISQTDEESQKATDGKE
jgi:exodeoxyribonuclease VII small subunit